MTTGEERHSANQRCGFRVNLGNRPQAIPGVATSRTRRFCPIIQGPLAAQVLARIPTAMNDVVLETYIRRLR